MFKLNRFVIKSLLIYFSVMVLTSCVGMKTGTHYDEKYFFDGYKTFSWISKQPVIKGEDGIANIDPLTLKKIIQSIQAELESKGYQYLDNNDQADFGLTFTVGSREGLTVESFPVDYRHHWDWYWHGNFHTYNQWHVRSWTEGTLTIDIFDNSNKEPIWHGWATKTVSSSDRKDPTESIKLAVSEIFKDFPFIQ